MLKVIYRSETQQPTKSLREQNIKQPVMMLKTILNFSGVEVLSREELKNMNGSGGQRCTIPWTPFPYNGPCIMLPPVTPVEPLEPFPEEPLLKP
ncbi:hypothetical protein D0817_19460 [Flavobacterium cupreum]|uniref:Uncharacterized protein n=1 Tax=Flavobacterium cupreum TaxID=2133766 RepID=A0A434A3A1_9FLAO|nr:hypothetical protein D0817_19460 [Flavobacterium cupreum]